MKASVSKFLHKVSNSFMRLFLVLILVGRKRPQRNVLSICGCRDRCAITGGSLRHLDFAIQLLLRLTFKSAAFKEAEFSIHLNF